MSKQINTIRCFYSDSIACQIISTFYDEKNPIEFDIATIVQVLGTVPSTARRVLSELYYANCISKFGHHQTTMYIITKENSLQFSSNVVSSYIDYSQKIIRKKKNKKTNSELALIMKKRKNKLRCKRTPFLTDQCMVCRLWFSWNGLRTHRHYCKKKPLSFARTSDAL